MSDTPRDPTWACAQTVYRFFRCLDENQIDLAATLFTEDGIWFRRGEPLTGRAAVLAALAERPADRITRHLITNIIVDEDGPTMTVRYDVTIFSNEGTAAGPPPLSPPHTLLTCVDRLVETSVGWRFASRSSRVVFAGR